jgi:flagellar FliJ protein
MAPSFQFGLRRVRDIRAHDEDLAKEQFAASLSQRVRGEAMLRAAEEQLRQARQTPPSEGVGPVSATTFLTRQAWVDRLQRSRDAAAHQLTGLEVALQRSRTNLTDASRAREVLDQLEARQREAHRLESARREGIELDEMALQVHARQRAA